MTLGSLDLSGTQAPSRDVSLSLLQKRLCKKKVMFEGIVELPGCAANVLIQTSQ